MRRKPLRELAIQYFTRRGYRIEKRNPVQDYSNPSSRRYDLIVQKGGATYPVWIKEWNRTVGVNIVINIDKAAESAGFSTPILVAEKFSEHARAYANRRGIKLITRSDILRRIRIF